MAFVCSHLREVHGPCLQDYVSHPWFDTVRAQVYFHPLTQREG
jgi:hypothetical protein